MDRIGVRELRANAATTVRRAGSGERVVVTVGGRPMAQIGPLEAPDGGITMDDLVAAGLVLAPRRRMQGDRLEDALPAWSGTRLDRLLRELRG